MAWLQGFEPAASRVEAVLAERPVMSWVNLGEVFCVTMRTSGRESARAVVGSLRRVLTLDEAGPARVIQAAEIKALHPMAFADAFAVATAQAHGAALLTGDPEILDGGGDWDAEDLRA